MSAEHDRLQHCDDGKENWKHWGPYLSERQWGTVREDYSSDGNAWDFFSFDVSHLRTYRWGEDGIGGWSDDEQQLCFCLGMWNGKDHIIKERLFGLTNSQGNHGEDVKEYYYYLDATPTHSYAKMLYKYPQAQFPYEHLKNVNRERGFHDPEFELLDTSVFDENRYFDVYIEYAQAGVDDLLVRATAYNRGPEKAQIHLMPQLWFRNTWSFGGKGPKPSMKRSGGVVTIEHAALGTFYATAEDGSDLIFCNNESNTPSLYGCQAQGPFKDGLNAYVVHGDKAAVSSESGTKVGFLSKKDIEAGGSASVRIRLSKAAPNGDAFKQFDATFEKRISEADQFYGIVQKGVEKDQALIQRQALAGMIWTKQYFNYNVFQWLQGDPGCPPPPEERKKGRNADWEHMVQCDIISMPDKWEYPWYAAWDLAFHCIPLALIDVHFAKQQLLLMVKDRYMHPNGQLPAYEWNFGDVNPPVHGWATYRVYEIDKQLRGQADTQFLEVIFHRLMVNFTWWVNRKDKEDMNVFQGGFLGLDNIGVFDRSHELPTGGHINQSDGTAWMAFYSLTLMRMALELAKDNPIYEDIASKFLEHFMLIAKAMTKFTSHGVGLWDEEDGFFYDVLTMPDGNRIPLKVRSMVGLLPLIAVDTIEPELLEKLPTFKHRMESMLEARPDLHQLVTEWDVGGGQKRLLSLVRGDRLKALIKRLGDPAEFLSEYGIRGLSRVHADRPYNFEWYGSNFSVNYEPGESTTGMFGGNSNWRGPIWMPVNYLILESLQKFNEFYTDDYKVEFPTGSGKQLTLREVASDIGQRLVALFALGQDGQRASMKQHPKMAEDPHFRDNLLFWEYFHGDTGRGIGANHQTGWTGCLAKVIQMLSMKV